MQLRQGVIPISHVNVCGSTRVHCSLVCRPATDQWKTVSYREQVDREESDSRWSLSQSSLAGLVYYEVEEEALRSGVVRNREERRRGPRAKRRALNIHSSDHQILQIELSPATVKQRTFSQDYDSVVHF